MTAKPRATDYSDRARPVLLIVSVVLLLAGVVAAKNDDAPVASAADPTSTSTETSKAETTTSETSVLPTSTLPPLNVVVIGGFDSPPSPPTTPPVIAIPAEVRGATGDVVDSETLVENEQAAQAYVPPPPVPNRQPLRPPTLFADTPDPQIVSSGGTFAVFSTNSGGRNVPVRTSSNLADWSEPIDAVPTLPSWGRKDVTWAPSVAAINGRWVLAVAVRSASRPRHCIGLFTSSNLTGPYRSTGGPVVCGGHGAIDPHLYVHNGEAFLYWKAVSDSGRQIAGARLNVDSLELEGDRSPLLFADQEWEGYGIENPAMVEANGKLLLFYAGNWWTDRRYAIGFAECEGPLGPCHKVTTERPWLSSGDGSAGPGGATFAVDPTGQVWMAYHAWVNGEGYQNGGYRPTHAEPIHFENARPQLINRPAEGAFESWARVPGGAFVGGWAGDVDYRHPTWVEIFRGGDKLANTVAGWGRSDLGFSRPDLGANHGFLHSMTLAAGTHELCAQAVDDLEAGPSALGCLTVTIDPAPFGELEVIEVEEPRTVKLSGWALDPDTAEPIHVRVVVDGSVVSRAIAGGPRPDVGQRHLMYGDNHGFAVSVSVSPGDHQVCVGAIDDAGASVTSLRCSAITVVGPPPTTTSTTTSTTTTTTSTTTSTTAPTSTTSTTLPTTTVPTSTTSTSTTSSTSTTTSTTSSTTTVP